MTRIRFDQLAKQYLEEFLQPLGIVQRNLEVPGESKFVDVWFVPAERPDSTACDLGLLTHITSTACLLEPFRNSPLRQEIRTCVLKLLWLQEDQRRKTEQSGSRQTESDLPKLWILAATTRHTILQEFGGQPRPDQAAGIYFLAEAFKTAVIAIDQLPQTEETLWLRLLGRDAVQQQAIAEVLALPATDPRRSRVLQLLVAWKVTIEIAEVTEQEANLMTTLSQVYLEWEQQTKQQGIEQGERSLILRLLSRRVGEVPEEMRSQINQLSIDQLEQLGEALLDFSTCADLEAWLSMGNE